MWSPGMMIRKRSRTQGTDSQGSHRHIQPVRSNKQNFNYNARKDRTFSEMSLNTQQAYTLEEQTNEIASMNQSPKQRHLVK